MPTIREKLGIGQKDIFKDAVVEIIKQERPTIDFHERMKRLPYVFKDPIKFDKKVDPKKLRFGSKISADVDFQREKYYFVKEVVSPEVLILNNGLRVRLLGVREKLEKNGAAVQFLKEKTRGQKVFMKFDTVKYDGENNLLCYLYLWNKTFLNAHLVKNKLVDVETKFDYRYKSKFSDLHRQAL